MTLRHSLLLGIALATAAGAAHAQQRQAQSRDDLLDALTRHIQICTEMSDNQARLSCYDRLQTQVGGVQAGPPSPTPLRPGTPATGAPPSVQAIPSGGAGPSMTGQTLTAPPLNMPGG